MLCYCFESNKIKFGSTKYLYYPKVYKKIEAPKV